MQTRRRQPRRVPGSRPKAFGLSLLLVGLQLLGLAHLGLERHGVCWEHGTLTELGAPRPASLESSSVGNALGLHARQSSAALKDADADHHCPVQASRRDWGNPAAGSPLELALGVTADAIALGASVPRADPGLLDRAPKQSPPATTA